MSHPCRLIGLVALGVLAATLSACTQSGPRIALDSPRPLEPRFNPHRAEVVAGRFMLLPVGPAETKYAMFASGSFVFSGSAWTGLYFGKGAYGSEQWLNVEVIDLQSGTHRTVFDRQVALGGWGQSFRAYERGELMFDSLLILAARTEDTNGDKQIDQDDAALAYVYNLASAELRQISPEGHSVERMEVRDDGIVLVLQGTDAPNTFAVYNFDPQSQQGRFIVTGLTP